MHFKYVESVISSERVKRRLFRTTKLLANQNEVVDQWNCMKICWKVGNVGKVGNCEKWRKIDYDVIRGTAEDTSEIRKGGRRPYHWEKWNFQDNCKLKSIFISFFVRN